MEKCDCCLEAGINPGDEPNCVKACIFGALHFGTIEELEAKRQGVAKKLEGSTGPSMLIA